MAMLCVNPQGPQRWPCSRCKTCRINRKRDWIARMMLEAASSEAAFFVTLTYRLVQFSPDGIPTLDADHTQRWLKRLRRRVGLPIRFFLVGEYGTKTRRPHYHVVLFFPNIDFETEANIHSIVSDTWGLGSVHIGDVSPDSLAYCLGYAVKGLTKKSQYPEGVYPEFARFSKGLGKFALSSFRLDGMVLPAAFHVGGKSYVIPRYLRRKLKDEGYTFEKGFRGTAEAEAVLSMYHAQGQLAPREVVEFLQQATSLNDVEREKSRLRTKFKLQSNLLGKVKNETL